MEGVGFSSNRLWKGAALLLLGIASGACGGSPAGAGEPAATPHERSVSTEANSASTEDDAPAEEEAPKAGPCDDGTCSACGAGICPAGWYCDESAKGGPACGWLPACAQKSSCACVTAKLGSSCACSEQSAGLHVTCK